MIYPRSKKLQKTEKQTEGGLLRRQICMLSIVPSILKREKKNDNNNRTIFSHLNDYGGKILKWQSMSRTEKDQKEKQGLLKRYNTPPTKFFYKIPY